MKIAIAQLNPTIGDLKGNAESILEVAIDSSRSGADLLITPELSLCGYPPRDLLLNKSFIGAARVELENLARELPPRLATLVGFPEINPEAGLKGEKPLFNSAALIENGEIKRVFRKRLLPTYDVFDEDRYFARGKESRFFDCRGVKIGVTICEDLWNDEEFWGDRKYSIDPLADLAASGADLIVNLSASPYSFRKQQLRESLLSHSARRHSRPIIYVNQVGGNDDLIFDGNSTAFNDRGELIYRARGFGTDVNILEYNGNLEKSRVNPLPDEDGEIYNALVLGVRDYARKCGFKRAILGLSGGIDSSLVAAIATGALGKENVLGVMMPGPYSSEHSLTDAIELGRNLGIKIEKIPIGEIMAVYDRVLEPLFAGTPFGIAEENLQSRIRGNLLMALANKFGYLLLSTGNKSEMAVGYCTLYGDMNGGLAAISDVPKTRVYTLCRWLNREREVIPGNVLIKPPSAELRPDQKDSDSLPEYDVLDSILELLIDRHESAREIADRGFDKAIVERVARLVKNAEFKRKQAPPGLKITDRAFGTGWRMPIARG